MALKNLRSICYSDEITVFWDKDGKNGPYNLLINGEKAESPKSTHFTLSGLTADTEYSVEIEGEKLLLQTAKEKNKIDISKAPYNAVGDGKTMNTAAIQQAVNDCGNNDVVYIPAGVYVTAALDLHSDMELYLDENAVLLGTANPEDYLPKIHSRFEGLEMTCYRSFLNMGTLDHTAGYNCENVVIRGKGTIQSGGAELAKATIRVERENLRAFIESLSEEERASYENADTIPGRMRSRLIQMNNCRNITISGVTLKDGASWNVQFIYSDNITTFNSTFISEGVWNGDGWDPDSSTNCTIFGCRFFTGDDSVAIKSGKNPEGNIINRPTEHIRVFDCACAYGHGITVGSEMSGGVSDVRIWDCDMGDSFFGIEIKGTKKRGGYVRGIHVDNCTVSHITFHAVGYNDDGVGSEFPPVFENCSFTNLRLYGMLYNHEREWHDCPAVKLAGFDVPGYKIKNILLDNITIARKEGVQTEEEKHPAPIDPKMPAWQRPVQFGLHTLTLGLCEGITIRNLHVN